MRWLIRLLALVARVRLFGRKFRLGIRRNELVLDVGSGNDPHPRADVLCDSILEGNSERAGPLARDSRPFVLGDLENLPFADKAFDYVISSYVLEHVRSPDRAISELMRVGRRGYIETPSEFTEKLASLPFHRWFVRLEEGTLIFRKKLGPCYDPLLSSHFFSMWQERDPSFLLWSFCNSGRGLVQYHWMDRIDYKVEDDQAADSWQAKKAEGPTETYRRKEAISRLRHGVKWALRASYSVTATQRRRRVRGALSSIHVFRTLPGRQTSSSYFPVQK
jgi:SAM-dependent methyltransferase